MVVSVLSDESYSALQAALVLRPEQGQVMPGTGGLRKLRWRQSGQGKRGGLRIIYYWDKGSATIFMLSLYRKSRTENLTDEQIRILARLVREEFR
jgi:hypothetical protein